MNEFVIEWLRGSDYAAVTAPNGSALKTKLQRLAEEHPEEVKIVVENKDSSVFAHIPVRYVRVGRPRELSEEQKQKAGERLREIRNRKTAEETEDGTEETEEEWEEDSVTEN